MTVKAAISLTGRQDAFARSPVAERRFSSVSAVVRRARRAPRREADAAALRSLPEQRRAGAFVGADEARQRTETMPARKRAAPGLDAERSAGADLDLALIFDVLRSATLDFGAPTDRASERAARRARPIDAVILALGNAPDQGTLDPRRNNPARHDARYRPRAALDRGAMVGFPCLTARLHPRLKRTGAGMPIVRGLPRDADFRAAAHGPFSTEKADKAAC